MSAITPGPYRFLDRGWDKKKASDSHIASDRLDVGEKYFSIVRYSGFSGKCC
jgi:hypothetical protein